MDCLPFQLPQVRTIARFVPVLVLMRAALMRGAFLIALEYLVILSNRKGLMMIEKERLAQERLCLAGARSARGLHS